MAGGNSSYGGYKDLDAAVHEAARIIAKIHSYGMKAGVSIKPRTPVEVVFDLMDKADLILVMTVEPGFGGQKYIPESTDREDEIEAISLRLLRQLVFGNEGLFAFGESVRLIGVAVSGLDHGDFRQMNLFDYMEDHQEDVKKAERRKKLDDMLQAEENVLARTANTKPARDNRTGLLVTLQRANTTFIQREFGHIDSKTEFVNDIVVNAQRYFETWEYQISTNLITDRKGTIHGLVDDWGITLKTARSWLKAEPDRDKVLKLCRTLDADMNRTNRVLSHYASYSVLDEKDPVDSVWIRLIGMRRDELETSGGPQEVMMHDGSR